MWWRQVWDVDDRFRLLVADLIHWENHQHNEKVADIMIMPPTSQIGHYHKGTNITMSPTTLSPICSASLKLNHRGCHVCCYCKLISIKHIKFTLWTRAMVQSTWNWIYKNCNKAYSTSNSTFQTDHSNVQVLIYSIFLADSICGSLQKGCLRESSFIT